MRYGISAVAMAAALCLMGASGGMNFLFWLTQGQTEREAQILGSVSVAFDVFKSVLPICIAWAWAKKNRAYVLLGSALFLLFFGFSFLSALGFAASNRGNVSGGRETLGLRLDAATTELDRSKARLQEIGKTRAQSVIEAEITNLQQDKFWRGSQYCNWPSGGEAQNFCKTYFGRRAELAGAVEADRLMKRIAELTHEIQELKSHGAGGDKDPQARMLAALAGLAPDRAQKVLIVAFAFLVELGAAFGLFLATGHSFGGSEGDPMPPKGKGRDPIVVTVADPILLEAPKPVPLRFKRLNGGGLIVDDGAGKA